MSQDPSLYLTHQQLASCARESGLLDGGRPLGLQRARNLRDFLRRCNEVKPAPLPPEALFPFPTDGRRPRNVADPKDQ